MLQSKIKNKFLDTFRHIEFGTARITMPDGTVHEFWAKNDGPQAELVIHDMRAISSLALNGDVGFAESYRDGYWDSPDLTAVFEFGIRNEQALDRYIYGSFLGRIASRLAYLFTRNTMKGSKKNIHAHYDLGNEFYKLWLDPTMTYSSALYDAGATDLISAQHRKYDRIIDRLGPSGSVLEIGCGWGGFAERAVQQGDYAVKGLTISKEQHDYATHRLKGEAHIALEDYRLQRGKFDNIVSIEMFEAVGEEFWGTYFGKVKSLLASKGRAVIQTITIRDEYFERYRKGGDAIRSFIFPGGMLPSPERFVQASGAQDLLVTDQFAFGRDYARTLQEWLDRFDAKLDQVKALGFDDKFIRMWRFYLTCCIAAFDVGRINVMQMELRHAS